MNGSDRFQKYVSEFKEKPDQEIVDLFNGEVGKPGWCSSRASYIAALHHEFERRNFDFSNIGGGGKLSFRSKIKLDGKKILYATPHSKNETGPDVIVVKPYLKANEKINLP